MSAANALCSHDVQVTVSSLQGWAWDVRAWDRDLHLPRSRRDQDVGPTSWD